MKYYDRNTHTFQEETEYGQKPLEFLYGTAFGRLLLKIVTMPFVSNLVRLYKASRLSKGSIKKFAEKHAITVTPEELASFKSFNDFFIRRRERVFCEEPHIFTSPADSKLSVFYIDENLRLPIKNSTYSVEELVEDKELAKRFSGCLCLVFRLAVDDMHHYFYVDNGTVISRKKIKGKLHTVRAISEEHRVFARNKREVTVMETENFGLAVQIEVGALSIGRIVNSNADTFKRGDEKGYFEFGGSTVVLLLEKTPTLDEDIQAANKDGYETRVCAGERLGEL